MLDEVAFEAFSSLAKELLCLKVIDNSRLSVFTKEPIPQLLGLSVVVQIVVVVHHIDDFLRAMRACAQERSALVGSEDEARADRTRLRHDLVIAIAMARVQAGIRQVLFNS